MDNNTARNTSEITEERIDFVDSLISSPQKRTIKVYEVIMRHNKEFESSQISNWDIVCFCVGYLAGQVAVFPWLSLPVKNLGQYILNTHYILTSESGLLPENGIQSKS